MNMKTQVYRLLTFIFSLLLGTSITPAIKNFLLNFVITGTATVITGGLGMITTILAGRLLGPEEFGRYNLMMSIGQFLVLLMVFGIPTALAQGLPRSTNISRTIRSSVPLITVSFISTILVALFITRPASMLLHLSPVVWWWGIALGAAYAVRVNADAILRGTQAFRTSAKLDIGSTAASSLLFIVFLLLLWREATAYATVTLVGALLYGTLGAFTRRQMLGWEYTEETKSLASYGFLALLIAGATVLLLHFDRLIIQYFYDATAVGIYSAYLVGALFLTSFMVTVTNYILLPMSSAVDNIRGIYLHLKRVSWVIISSVSAIAFLTTLIFMRVLGRAYPFVWSWIILVSLYAGLFFYANILGILSHSRGKMLLATHLRIVGGISILFVLVAIGLTRQFGLTGTFSGLVIAYTLLIFALSLLLEKRLNV
jgi:hypothetical protein